MDPAERQMNEGSLRLFAIREFEFNQFDITTSQADSDDGRCVPLVAKWLSEKRDTSNGWLARFGRRFGGEDRDFAGPSYNLDYNVQIYKAVADIQAVYSRTSEMYDVFQAFNLKPKSTSAERPDVIEGIVEATNALGLHSGFAVNLKITGKAVGHMIGIYRSKGGNLHFFDPNFGIYKINDLQNFLQAWQKNYTDLKTEFYLDATKAAIINVS
jgi:hypothetical protein